MRVILPQIAQMTQRNAVDGIISQRKTVCAVNVVLGFVCVNQRNQRETLGFLCADRLSTLACYSPADGAEVAEECSRAAFIPQRL